MEMSVMKKNGLQPNRVFNTEAGYRVQLLQSPVCPLRRLWSIYPRHKEAARKGAKYCSVSTDASCVPQYDYPPSSDICTYSNTSDIPDINMPGPSSFDFGTVQFPDWWTGMQQKQEGHLMDVVSFSLFFFIVYVCSIDNTTTYYNQLRQTYRK